MEHGREKDRSGCRRGGDRARSKATAPRRRNTKNLYFSLEINKEGSSVSLLLVTIVVHASGFE